MESYHVWCVLRWVYIFLRNLVSCLQVLYCHLSQHLRKGNKIHCEIKKIIAFHTRWKFKKRPHFRLLKRKISTWNSLFIWMLWQKMNAAFVGTKVDLFFVSFSKVHRKGSSSAIKELSFHHYVISQIMNNLKSYTNVLKFSWNIDRFTFIYQK